jgi:hypothetical protein
MARSRAAGHNLSLGLGQSNAEDATNPIIGQSFGNVVARNPQLAAAWVLCMGTTRAWI